MIVFFMWRLLPLLLILFLYGDAFAETYLYIDPAGVVTFTDQAPVSAKKPIKTAKASPKPTGKVYTVVRNLYANEQGTSGFSGIIHSKALKYDIDPSLIKAVIKVESNYNTHAISMKGAMGLMQLMPQTADELGVYNPFNPEENIEAGVKYLKKLIKHFNGDLRLALAAYNAGPTAVKKYGSVPPYKETTDYVKKVFTAYRGSGGEYSGMSSKKRNDIYKVMLKDGSILYTNSEIYKAHRSRL